MVRAASEPKPRRCIAVDETELKVKKELVYVDRSKP